MANDDPKFRPKGKPLTQAEIDLLTEIRAEDIERAIRNASPRMREFLEAKGR